MGLPSSTTIFIRLVAPPYFISFSQKRMTFSPAGLPIASLPEPVPAAHSASWDLFHLKSFLLQKLLTGIQCVEQPRNAHISAGMDQGAHHFFLAAAHF